MNAFNRNELSQLSALDKHALGAVLIDSADSSLRDSPLSDEQLQDLRKRLNVHRTAPNQATASISDVQAKYTHILN
jgi:hypothetical protein